MKNIKKTKEKILNALSDEDEGYTLTPKEFKKNSREALKKSKEELVKIVLKEKEIQEKKEHIIHKINYWKNLK